MLDNCQFVTIFNELKEVPYLKKYYNYIDQKVKSFVTSDLIMADIDEEYNDALNKLSKNDQFYEIKQSSIETQRNNSLYFLESFNKKKISKTTGKGLSSTILRIRKLPTKIR